MPVRWRFDAGSRERGGKFPPAARLGDTRLPSRKRPSLAKAPKANSGIKEYFGCTPATLRDGERSAHSYLRGARAGQLGHPGLVEYARRGHDAKISLTMGSLCSDFSGCWTASTGFGRRAIQGF